MPDPSTVTETEKRVIDEDGETLFREPEVVLTDRPAEDGPIDEQQAVFDMQDLSVFYGDFRAVRNVEMVVRRHEITAFIGPSGCGKSTVLRCLNRMNDLIPSARVEGRVLHHGVDLYDPQVDAVEVRRRVG
ncbi:MAG TPA: ATP-binding cassette domain-containing protein, partial [Acidimicrobiia bacterium]|nr:ATP-binding cassette domain-containing protein [Acidimicrobiia bacterium]